MRIIIMACHQMNQDSDENGFRRVRTNNWVSTSTSNHFPVGGLEHFLFFHTLRMSSSLTFIFFRGVGLNHQPAVCLNICYPMAQSSG